MNNNLFWKYDVSIFEGTLRYVLEKMSEDIDLSHSTCEILKHEWTPDGVNMGFGKMVVIYRVINRTAEQLKFEKDMIEASKNEY